MASEKITHTSLRPDVVIPDNESVTQHVFGSIPESVNDKVAIINGPSGATVTYGQLRAGINRAMNGLKAAGFTAGDVFAIHLPNIPQFLTVFHAVAQLGGTLTTSNPMYGPEELAHQLTLTKAKYIITIAMFKDTCVAAAEASGVSTVYVLEEGVPFLMCDDDTPCPPAEFNAKEQLLVIPFSSGTSGLPKGVELTHYSVVANLCQLMGDGEFNLDFKSDDVVLGLLPAFHIFGMTIVISTALKATSTVVLMPKFDPKQFLELVATHKISYIPIVPPIALFLAKHPLVDSFDTSSLRIALSGAAPLSEELTNQFETRLGIKIMQGYGMTELSPASHIGVAASPVAGSCGRLLPNTEARIVDPETGATQPAGTDEQRGELLIRGPQVMAGYHRNAEATAETIDAEGFLHTGDVAYVDAEGNYYIVDRIKELIKTKGFQVAPAELEAVLLGHEDIADAAVIGVADERAGEVPKAFVVLKPGKEVTAEAVMAYVAEHVAVFKQVKLVEFTDAIPKSASGKILRRVLRAREAEAATK